MINKFKKIGIYILIVLLLCGISFSSYSASVYRSKNNFSFDDGPVVISQYDLAVTGDSYAGLFCDFERDRVFNLVGYAIAGHTVVENQEIMTKAFISNEKLILVSIGVNDHYNGTMPYQFEAILRGLLNLSVEYNKTVILHTYMNYPMAYIVEKRFSTFTYDYILQKLANEYSNVYYINLSDYQDPKYALDDNIHYGKEFYDNMYRKIVLLVKEILS